MFLIAAITAMPFAAITPRFPTNPPRIAPPSPPPPPLFIAGMPEGAP